MFESVNDIMGFLNEKPGYLKKSPIVLVERIFGDDWTDAQLSKCASALSQVRASIKEKEEPETQVTNTYIEDLELKSAWQTSGGEWRYSYGKPKAKDEDLSELKAFKEEFLHDLSRLKQTSILSHSFDNKKKNKETIAFELCTPDLHFGKGPIEETYANGMAATVQLVEQALASYNIEQFILPIGNDGLNSEGMRAATTKGTPQEDSVPWYVSFKCYWQFLIEQIEFLSSIAPVKVIVVQGNHDYERQVYIGDVLQARFEKYSNIIINNEVEPRKYVTYGNNLIGYTHGENNKAQDLPLIMATEVSREFADTKFREFHLGHYHKENVDEFRGVKVRYLPSLTSVDTWHKQQGYKNMQCAQGLCWSKNEGLKSIIQYNL